MNRILGVTPPINASAGPWSYSGVLSSGLMAASDEFNVRYGDVLPVFIIGHFQYTLAGGDGTSTFQARLRGSSELLPKPSYYGRIPSYPDGQSWDSLNLETANVDLAAAAGPHSGTKIAIFTICQTKPIPLPFEKIWLEVVNGGLAYSDGGTLKAYFEMVG